MIWFHFALGVIVPILQMAIKNPQSIEKERVVLTEIRDLLNQLIPSSPSQGS